MSVNFNLNTSAMTTPVIPAATTSTTSATESAATKETENAAAASNSDVAAVYEKSTADDTAGKVTAKNTKQDRSAIISQLKADAEQRQNQLMDIVRKTMTGQGLTLAKADDMWSFLAGGNFTVDAATKAQAQADIAEDGYWGVEKTSDRILDFAKALAGDDPAQADKFLDAFKKGFEQATGTWGKKLPDISSQTYDAVVKKFEDWKNSANTSSTDEMTQAATNEIASQAAAATLASGN